MLEDKINLYLFIDVTQMASWESVIAAFLDNIPFDYIGKGEQNLIKITLSIEGNLKEI